MIPPRHFYMIRHGETEANRDRIMAGSLDTPLTNLGRTQADQARVIVEQLTVKPTVIIHSNLSRARDTARIINANLALPMSEDPELAEIHVGDLEGAPWEACDFFDDYIDPPNGETFPEFFERVRRAKKRALETHEGPVLIVSHGGVFRALWKIYGHDMLGVRNCHLHEFIPHPERKVFPFLSHVYDYDQSVTRTEVTYHKAEETD